MSKLETMSIPVKKLGRDLQFYYRPDTTDEKAILEVVKRNVYFGRDFRPNIDEKVADLGANIGSFSILAAAYGAKVLAVEPIPENIDIMRKNIKLNGLEGQIHILEGAVAQEPIEKTCHLYLPKRAANHYRASIIDDKKEKNTLEVPLIDIDGLLKGFQIDSVKMDIEGAEKDILSYERNWDMTGFLTFEWHFDYHPSVRIFEEICALQKKSFQHQRITKMPEGIDTYNFFPSGRIQRFWNTTQAT